MTDPARRIAGPAGLLSLAIAVCFAVLGRLAVPAGPSTNELPPREVAAGPAPVFLPEARRGDEQGATPQALPASTATVTPAGSTAPATPTPDTGATAGTPATPTVAAPLELADLAGGPSMAVAVQGDVAYLGRGARIEVLDRTDPDHPVFLRATVPLAGTVTYLAADGGRLYALATRLAADGYTMVDEFLHVLDLGDPRSPRLTGTLALDGYVKGLVARSPFLYLPLYTWPELGPGPHGLYVADVIDPGVPHIAHRLDLDGRWPIGAVSRGDFLYVDTVDPADARSDRLVVLDLHDPAQPRPVPQATPLEGIGAHRAMAVNDHELVACGSLRIVDLTDALAPRLRPESAAYSEHVGATVYAAAALGDRFVVETGGSLILLRPLDEALRNPDERPRFIDSSVTLSASPSTQTHGIAAAGTRAYAAIMDGGLVVADFADPRAGRLTGGYRPDLSPRCIARSGRLLVGGADRALVVDELGPGGALTRRGALALGLQVGCPLALDGALSLVAGGGTLKAVDLSAPDQPLLAGELAGFDGKNVRALAMAGGFAYAATEEHGLDIVDLRSPAHMTVVRTIPAAAASPDFGLTGTNDIALMGAVAIVADGLGGVKVLDIRQPAEAVVVAALPLSGRASNVAAGSGLAFLRLRWRGVSPRPDKLVVVDLREPASPAVLAELTLPGQGDGLWLDGPRLLVGLDDASLQVLNVADPARPTWLGGLSLPGVATGVAPLWPGLRVTTAAAGSLTLLPRP
jgi:hypothetical protein